MRALAIVHQRDAGPGVFEEAMRARGVELGWWLPAEQESPAQEPDTYDAVLVLGGAMNVDDDGRLSWMGREKALLAGLLERGVPLLGVCLGAQLLAEAAGAQAGRASEPEIGWHDVVLTPDGTNDPVLGALPPRFEAFQWHSYEFSLPPGATALASSPVCLQAFRAGESAWGIQFHAEVTGEDAEAWIDDYRSDEDAVRIGLDPDDLRRRTRAAIGGWNVIGRGVCERFLAAVYSGVR